MKKRGLAHQKENYAKSPKDIPVWALPQAEIYPATDSSAQGLSHLEAIERIKKYGKNEFTQEKRQPAWLIFLLQFRSPLVFILLIAAVIAYFLGDHLDAIVIISIVVLNAGLGFYQEYKAERSLRELRKFITHHNNVLRDGHVLTLDSREIVPGDVVYLQRGDIVPADIRLFQVENLSTDESTLTGESFPVEKTSSAINPKYSLPQDLKNMALAGSTISSGTGEGIVITTGNKTFLGKTAHYLAEGESHGEFHKGILKFSNFLLKIVLITTIIVFAVNAFLDKEIITSFLFAIALAVGITPEVLPIIITVALSNGAQNMAKEKVVIKKLASIEDIGNMDILCSDKTGTLTEGKMSLSSYVNIQNKKDPKILLYGLLCNSIKKEKHHYSFENPIDRAIVESPDIKKIAPEAKQYHLLQENEFDFTRRMMSVLVLKEKTKMLIVKGAAETLLAECTFIDKKTKITSLLRQELEERVKKYEQTGLKPIAIAEKISTKDITTKDDEQGLTLLGFLLFHDPPKKIVREALHTLQKQDVQVKIITGDSPEITHHVCREVNLPIVGERILLGSELEKMNPTMFNAMCNNYNVFARVSPEQKLKIVKALQERGHIVGFLGDGINDAPALHQADVGITVNTASSVAKGTADIILLHKSLNVLSQGIREGRKTFGNIMKYIFNTISANFGNMFTIAISSFFLRFIPLLPSQILLANFLTDFPMLTLSKDRVDEELLHKPRRWNIKFISKFMYLFGIISSFFDLLFIVPLILVFKVTPELFRTAWFTLSILTELVGTFTIRTRKAFYRSKPSLWFVGMSIFTVALTVLIITSRWGNKIFSFVRIPPAILLYCFGVLTLYVIALEIAKRKFYKKVGE
ncbi:magnesium-translocating P-type ATPase [Candidatus Woesearchaeota archaeon]|nr:magnesium-translocating P-type ATPase [Candidatus Woesearchaeota archaeon]